MINIHNLLLAIIATIIFYIGFEIMQTRESVVSANNRYEGKTGNVEFTKYGSKGKENAMAYQAKLTKDAKTVQQKKPDIKSVKLSDIQNVKPLDIQSIKTSDIKSIKLSGNIEKGLTYKIYTYYYSQSDSRWCKDYDFLNFGGGSHLKPEIKIYSYTPKIENGKHTIEIPLDEHNPDWGCKFRLESVGINIQSNGDKVVPYSQYTLFYPDWSTNRNPPGWGFTRKDAQKHIQVECLLPDIYNGHYDAPCGLSHLREKHAIEQRLVYSEYEFDINLLTEDAYYNDLFLHSKSYQRRLHFLQSKQPLPQNSTIYHQLKDKLGKHHDTLTKMLNENRTLLNKLIKSEVFTYNRRDNRMLQKLSKETDSIIKKLKSMITIHEQLLYDGTGTIKVGGLSVENLDDVFKSNEYYNQQIKYLMKKFKRAYKRESLEVQEKKLNNYHRGLMYYFVNIDGGFLGYDKCSYALKEALAPFHSQKKQFMKERILTDIQYIEGELLINN